MVAAAAAVGVAAAAITAAEVVVAAAEEDGEAERISTISGTAIITAAAVGGEAIGVSVLLVLIRRRLKRGAIGGGVMVDRDRVRVRVGRARSDSW